MDSPVKFGVLLWTAFISLHAFGQSLPPEAKKAFDSLPGKSLTVEFILGQGAQKSPSFKAAAAGHFLSEGAKNRAESPFNWSLDLIYRKTNDEFEQISPTAAILTKANAYSVGLSKYFITGTDFSLALETGDSDLNYSSFPSTSTNSTKALLSVSQNIWQDFFGVSSRRDRRAYLLESENLAAGAKDSLDEWAIQMVSTFYQAWYAKQSAFAAQGSRSRREKLERLTRTRVNRGTAESPDFLQIKSTTNTYRALELESLQSLSEIWKSFVITLDLPANWINIDPQAVPISLDEPIAQATGICRSPQVKEDFKLIAARKGREAAELRMESAKDGIRPDVEVFGTYGVNGVDGDSRADSIEEVSKQDHPGWTVGVQLSYPLGQDAARAEFNDALARRVQADAALKSANDTQTLSWKNGCDTLNRLIETRKLFEENAKNQAQRSRLEVRRYQIGRTTMQNLIQAEDDATNSELQLYQVETRLRLAAWQILRLNQSIYEMLKRYIPKTTGE